MRNEKRQLLIKTEKRRFDDFDKDKNNGVKDNDKKKMTGEHLNNKRIYRI